MKKSVSDANGLNGNLAVIASQRRFQPSVLANGEVGSWEGTRASLTCRHLHTIATLSFGADLTSLPAASCLFERPDPHRLSNYGHHAQF